MTSRLLIFPSWVLITSRHLLCRDSCSRGVPCRACLKKKNDLWFHHRIFRGRSRAMLFCDDFSHRPGFCMILGKEKGGCSSSPGPLMQQFSGGRPHFHRSICWTFVECGWGWIGAACRVGVTAPAGRAPDNLVAQRFHPSHGPCVNFL